MKGFNTYVITKKTLVKACVILLGIIILIGLTRKIYTNKSIAVFSYNAGDIIDKSTVDDDPAEKISEIVKDVLGFDVTEPKTIMDSSSAGIEHSNTPEPTFSPTISPKEASNDTELPSHNEIITADNIELNNATDYDIDLNTICAEPLDFKFTFDLPEVLIVHTHTTECYNGDAMTGENERTTNEAYNMCRIGEIVASTLEKHGIITIHDKTIHDYPTYQTAYSKTLKTIEKNIGNYPSIKVVLDIHRDAYIYSDGSKLSVSSDINGEKTAQVMLVLGTDSLGLEHPNWRSNIKFAAKIQNSAEKLYPGLMRPINLRRERFNMHLTTGSILLEIGSNGNSLHEAETSAIYIANAIAAVIKNG